MRGSRRVTLACSALAIGCGILGTSATALGKKPAYGPKVKKHAAGREGLSAHSYFWRVAIDGADRDVRAGGKLHYCVSEEVERLSIVTKLHAHHSGEHRYIVRVYGPKAAGVSFSVEKVVHGQQAELELGFSPLAFPVLTQMTNVPKFVPGTYRAQIKSIIGRELHKRSIALGSEERIKLTQDPSC